MKQEKNLPQYVSSAPMAQQQDFVLHEKTKYPFSPEPKRPKCVKITLNSGDRASGSLTSALFNIRLPAQFQNKQLNLVVDSFVVSSAPNSVSNLAQYPYYIRLVEYRNPHSYSSATGNTTGKILLTTGTTYFNNTPRDVGGCLVSDPTLFQRPVTIEFWSPHFDVAGANGITNAWSINLSLFDDVAE
jgi:hypothetical protein